MTRLKLGSLLIALALLGGCVPATAVTVRPLCGDNAKSAPIKPVCISKGDTLTEPTASQIEGNNLALERLCKISAEKECKKKEKKAKPVA